MKFVLFTDNLADLSIREASRAAKNAGFDGLDLTVRPGGHVRPDNASNGLPDAQKIADEEGAPILMITTAITAAESDHAENIINAAHARIPAFKLGYWHYQPFGTLAKQLDDARRKLDGIVRLCRRYHIRPCVHIHSGPILSNGPLSYLLLKDFAPTDVGAYVDPMHMSYEGAASGWEMTLDLLAPWVTLVGLKNYTLTAKDRDKFGQRKANMQYAPLADGFAPLPQFFQRLRQIGFDGVVSLHSEYKGEHSFRHLSTTELLEQSAIDLRYVKQMLARI
jgi:sugar phosphate isomerase/epimerase